MLPFLLNDVTASTSLSMPSSLLLSGFVCLWIQISQNGVCKTGRLISSLWALCIYPRLLLWAEITGHFAKFVKSLYWLLAWLKCQPTQWLCHNQSRFLMPLPQSNGQACVLPVFKYPSPTLPGKFLSFSQQWFIPFETRGHIVFYLALIRKSIYVLLLVFLSLWKSYPSSRLQCL